jgi:elongator complex protein 3
MKKEEKIIEETIRGLQKGEELNSLKRKISQKYKIPPLSNLELLKIYQNLLKKKMVKRSKKQENFLKTRPVRSLSGIVNISVLTKPYPCPGKCLFCPSEKKLPKSYLSGEPAVERAKALNFDPYLQVQKRIEALKLEGHPTEKIELRIVGGTWSFYPKKYQSWFIKRCFEAANGKKSKNLKEAQRENERAKNRIVGISIETRPDFINEKEISRLREFGVTLVEIGVQSVFEEILEKKEPV